MQSALLIDQFIFELLLCLENKFLYQLRWRAEFLQEADGKNSKLSARADWEP
jgi:hypothetical protein